MTATPKDLQDEPIWADGFQKLVTFGRNRSGIDSGELDFSIASFRVDGLSSKDKDELVVLLRRVADIIERQTPPESAGELLSKSNNAALLPIDNKPQACEHEWEGATLFDTDNTETRGIHCVKCLKFVAPNSPQEPKEGERDG